MLIFRGLLVVLLVALVAYTTVVIANHGWGLFPIFFGDIMTMAWPGQFNVDFTGFLTLSAVWTAWRNHFSPLGLVLAVAAFFGGILFLSIYLLITSYDVKGDINALLLGKQRAGKLP